MIEIKQYFSMNDWGKMHTFLSECYRKDLALCSQKYFKWQFQVSTDFGSANVVCGWNNGNLLGICGYIPVHVHWGESGKPVKAAWAINWIVKKKAPVGLGWLLFKKIQKMFPIVIGVGASKNGESFYKALEGNFYPRIPRYLSVLDKKQSVHMISPAASENEIDAYIFKTDFNCLQSPIDQSLNAENYSPDWELYPALAFGTIRSLEYLNWRYIDHPVFNYNILIKGKAKRPAVCVYRIEQTFGDYEARVGRVVEFFHPNDDNGKRDGISLMHEVLKRMQDFGCAYADFICSNKIYGQTIIDAGWVEESPDAQILPVRLSPIERKTRNQNLEFVVEKGLPLPRMEDMYITKSDGDEDRPARLHKITSCEDIRRDNCDKEIQRR